MAPKIEPADRRSHSTPAAPTIQVPFSSLAGGMPVATLDRANVVGIEWQLTSPLAGGADGGAACAAAFTASNLSFY